MKKRIFGNWKMNGSLASNAALLDSLTQGLGHADCEIAVCAPAPYLAQLQSLLSGSAIAIGAQDVSAQASEAGETEAVVRRQLSAVVQRNGHCLSEIVLAYEPVWAIGTGLTATPAQAQAVHAVLRAQLLAATTAAARVPILYGGSMNAANAAELLAQADIDGGLVGGASLKAADFLAIVACAG